MKRYGTLRFTDGRWHLMGLEPHVAIRAKQVFPQIPKGSHDPLTLADGLQTAADLIWFTSRYPLIIDDQDAAALKTGAEAHANHAAENERLFQPDYRPTHRAGFVAGQALRPYQEIALDFIERNRSCLVVDDMGLGKTYVGLAVAALKGARPLLIVVQAHLQQQWAEKAASFVNCTVYTPKGNKPYSLPHADIYIMKYNQLPAWVDYLANGGFNAVVFDEIQELRRGCESKKGMAARAITLAVGCAGGVCVGLTATPVYNYGGEIFNIANILRPGILDSRDAFLREWCGMSVNGKAVVTNPPALGTYLRDSHFMIRRTKADVGQQASQSRPHVEWLTPDLGPVEELEALTAQLARGTLTGSFTERGRAAREFDLRMRQMTGIAKAKGTAAFTDMLLASDKPVLLFGWHREVYRIWGEALKQHSPAFYTGHETQAQKEAAIGRFKSGETKLLIMSLRSGAGIDGLQHHCSTVVFGEFDWSPKVQEQCIGRVDRDGQTEPVFSFYMATDYGADPLMIDALGLKSSQARGITDPTAGPMLRPAQDPDRLKTLAKLWIEKNRKAQPND